MARATNSTQPVECPLCCLPGCRANFKAFWLMRCFGKSLKAIKITCPTTELVSPDPTSREARMDEADSKEVERVGG